MLIPRSIWIATLRDADGRTRTAATGNDILSPGRASAMEMLLGRTPPGIYKWVELGTSAQPINPTTQTGCYAPLLLADGVTHFRASGTWDRSGDSFDLSLAVPGTQITGPVREAALFPSSNQGGGPALYRVVFPSVLLLSSTNTLTLAIHLAA